MYIYIYVSNMLMGASVQLSLLSYIYIYIYMYKFILNCPRAGPSSVRTGWVVLSWVLLPRQYLLGRAKFIAWRPRRLKMKMPKGSSIFFVTTTHVS